LSNETGKFCDKANNRNCHYYRAPGKDELRTIGPSSEAIAGVSPFCWVEPSCPDFQKEIQGVPFKYCDKAGDTYAKAPGHNSGVIENPFSLKESELNDNLGNKLPFIRDD
jgi:hypothetical protein